jgi:hypothetical protein
MKTDGLESAAARDRAGWSREGAKDAKAERRRSSFAALESSRDMPAAKLDAGTVAAEVTRQRWFAQGNPPPHVGGYQRNAIPDSCSFVSIRG